MVSLNPVEYIHVEAAMKATDRAHFCCCKYDEVREPKGSLKSETDTIINV